jgi:hypothetical protein
LIFPIIIIIIIMIITATKYVVSHQHWKLLWRIDPFLGSDRETNNETTFAARQQVLISKNRRPLLWNGSVNTFRGNGYACNNRGTVGNGVFYGDPYRVFIRKKNGATKSLPCGGGVEYLHRNLRVVGGDKKASLESETVKYGRESQGIWTRE